MPHDLEFLQLALEQPALGTLDGCDFVRVDAVWCLPHDGSNPRFYRATHLWEQTPAGRAIGRERYIADLEAALAARDAKIMELARELAHRAAPPDLPPADETPVEAPAEALPCPLCDTTWTKRRALATHMQRIHKQSVITFERQLPPLLLARPAEPDAPQAARLACPECDKTYKNRSSLDAHRGLYHPPPIALPEPPTIEHELLPDAPSGWRCRQCQRDSHAPSIADPTLCMECARPARQAA